MKQSEVWYIDERAEQLAIVYLTRRDDLTILPAHEDDVGLDYLVRIRTASQQEKRVFGVQVKGVLERASIPKPTSDVSEINGTTSRGRSFPNSQFPVCEMLFVMKTDEGFYRWIQEPVITVVGKASLQSRRDTEFKPLDHEALATIVAQINLWYEAGR